MKRAIILVWTIFFLLLSGCQNSGDKSGGVCHLIPDNNQFPPSLAGIWKADASSWQITLAPDGNVVSVIDDAGWSMVLAEGGLFSPGSQQNEFLYIVYGPCYANYNPQTRQLSVTINIEHFHIELSDAVMDTALKHYFTGPVFENGKRWNVKLFNYARFEGDSSETFDPNLVDEESLVFNKVQNNQLSPPGNQ